MTRFGLLTVIFVACSPQPAPIVTASAPPRATEKAQRERTSKPLPPHEPEVRYGHEAVLLVDGSVLIVGGQTGNNVDGRGLASSALYLPDSDAWVEVGSISSPRGGHTVTALSDGAALVIGGYSKAGRVASIERYDPTRQVWELIGSLHEQRAEHTATLLSDGTVLVTGGYGRETITASSEIVNPATGTSETVAPMPESRYRHTATALMDSRVAVLGGFHAMAAGRDIMDVFDPVTRTWSLGPKDPYGRQQHQATALHDGRLLVTAGRRQGSSHADFMIFDMDAGTVHRAWNPKLERYGHRANLLGDGRVLITGGSRGLCKATSLVIDPSNDSIGDAPPMNFDRCLFTATLLSDGRVFVAGGYRSYNPGVENVTKTEIFDPTANSWQIGAAMRHTEHSRRSQ